MKNVEDAIRAPTVRFVFVLKKARRKYARQFYVRLLWIHIYHSTIQSAQNIIHRDYSVLARDKVIIIIIILITVITL